MRLVVRILGAEVFAIETGAEPEDDTERDLSGGTTAAYPVGFTPSPGDQRWEPSAGYE